MRCVHPDDEYGRRYAFFTIFGGSVESSPHSPSHGINVSGFQFLYSKVIKKNTSKTMIVICKYIRNRMNYISPIILPLNKKLIPSTRTFKSRTQCLNISNHFTIIFLASLCNTRNSQIFNNCFYYFLVKISTRTLQYNISNRRAV